MNIARFPGWDAVETLKQDEAALLFPEAMAAMDEIYSRYDWNPAYGGPVPDRPDVWATDYDHNLWAIWLSSDEGNDRFKFRKWEAEKRQWGPEGYWPR